MSAAERVGAERHSTELAGDQPSRARDHRHGRDRPLLPRRPSAPGSSPRSARAAFRHYFFEFGPHCTVAFFEYADAPAEPFVNRAGVPDERAPQFDHLALNVPDEQALHALRRRLQRHGCEVTDIVDHGVVRSVYFTDPNGIALEASWWVRDPTSQPADYGDPQLFADPDPVAAVVELQTTGTLTSTRDSTLAPTA